MSGRGIVTAEITEEAQAELWRSRDRRGFYTWLCGPGLRYLEERDPCFAEDFWVQLAKQQAPTLSRVLAESFDIVLLAPADAGRA